MLSGPVAFHASTSISTFSTCCCCCWTDVIVWSASRGRIGGRRLGSPTCIILANIFARRAALSLLLIAVDPLGLVREGTLSWCSIPYCSLSSAHHVLSPTPGLLSFLLFTSSQCSFAHLKVTVILLQAAQCSGGGASFVL